MQHCPRPPWGCGEYGCTSVTQFPGKWLLLHLQFYSYPPETSSANLLLILCSAELLYFFHQEVQAEGKNLESAEGLKNYYQQSLVLFYRMSTL